MRGLVFVLIVLLAFACNGGGPDKPPGRIAFVSDRYGSNHEIWLMNADGSNPRMLTNMPPINYDPSWSPTGRQIAFASASGFEPEMNLDIYVMDADGSNLRRLTDTSETEASPLWSPDGRRIAFGCNGSISLMNADGTGRRGIMGHPPSFGLTPDDWSPDGKQIAFSEGATASFVTFSEVYVADADGSNRRKLVQGPAYTAEAAWSRSGEQIAFTCAEKELIHFPGEAPEPSAIGICLVNSDGSGLRRIVENGSSPTWSPDGKWTAFFRDEDIYVIRANGTDIRKITDYPGQDRSPAWSPR